MQKLRSVFPSFLSGIINSYTQIFFSNNRIFALILMVVTFFDVWAGLSGIIAVMVSNILAYLIGFNRENIKKGYYGFNSLLVGLGLGVYYQPGLQFFIILLFASMLTLAKMVETHLEGILAHWKWGVTNAFMEGLERFNK